MYPFSTREQHQRYKFTNTTFPLLTTNDHIFTAVKFISQYYFIWNTKLCQVTNAIITEKQLKQLKPLNGESYCLTWGPLGWILLPVSRINPSRFLAVMVNKIHFSVIIPREIPSFGQRYLTISLSGHISLLKSIQNYTATGAQTSSLRHLEYLIIMSGVTSPSTHVQ